MPGRHGSCQLFKEWLNACRAVSGVSARRDGHCSCGRVSFLPATTSKATSCRLVGDDFVEGRKTRNGGRRGPFGNWARNLTESTEGHLATPEKKRKTQNLRPPPARRSLESGKFTAVDPQPLTFDRPRARFHLALLPSSGARRHRRRRGRQLWNLSEIPMTFPASDTWEFFQYDDRDSICSSDPPPYCTPYGHPAVSNSTVRTLYTQIVFIKSCIGDGTRADSGSRGIP